jgi:hypothetical protein
MYQEIINKCGVSFEAVLGNDGVEEDPGPGDEPGVLILSVSSGVPCRVRKR